MGYTHGTKWSDEMIKDRVLEVKEKMKLNRMPTRSECEAYYHDSKLTNVVGKRIGWYKLASELNLPIKNCETTFGKSFESKAEEMLQGQGFEVRKMSQNFPYDLLVNDCVKIDVKASHLYHGPSGNFYTFNLAKNYSTCDFYLLFAIIDDDLINKTMIVPSCHVIASNQISVGESKSKYHKYIDKWDLIENAVDYWGAVM